MERRRKNESCSPSLPKALNSTIYISIPRSVSMSISISTYEYIYTCDTHANFHAHVRYVREKFQSRQAATRAGVSAAAIRPTETPCRISSHVVASSQFREPGLRTPTV